MPSTIISASRRTDIPAYYSEWFMNRVREGKASWANPYNGKRCTASLRSDDVAAFVFWSKNFVPFLPHLPELDRLGYAAIFYFTITGLPKVFEPNVPDISETIAAARSLAEKYGPDAVLWRYDPIFTTSITDVNYHITRFREIASALEGSTTRCYFSFAQFYGKVKRNTEKLRQDTGISAFDLALEEKLDLTARLVDIAADHGIEMHSCCGDILVGDRVKKAKCVDADLLRALYPDRMRSFNPKPTRKECDCYDSKDIGAYDTCPHDCVYCYANSNKVMVHRNWERHDSHSDGLLLF